MNILVKLPTDIRILSEFNPDQIVGHLATFSSISRDRHTYTVDAVIIDFERTSPEHGYHFVYSARLAFGPIETGPFLVEEFKVIFDPTKTFEDGRLHLIEVRHASDYTIRRYCDHYSSLSWEMLSDKIEVS